MTSQFLDSTKKQFEYYKMLGDKTFAQLTDEMLFWQYNSTTNSIATIVQHLSGNMLSRWTDFLTTDGEKTWRKRDAEFEQQITDRATVLNTWKKGWHCLMHALNGIKEEQELNTIIYIRNQGHSILEAINRQLAHYPYHIGQIVFIGKMALSHEWQSLSIPKGNSDAYNEDKFSTPQQTIHFTNEYFNKK
jgi:hypothetical protein